MTCKKCAASLQEGQTYCPVCNTPVSESAQNNNIPNQAQGYSTPPISPYSSAPYGQPAAQASPYAQPAATSPQTTTAAPHQPQYTQPVTQGQPGTQQVATGYQQPPTQVPYQQPASAAAPNWQQPYGQPAYSQPNMYAQPSPYGRPLMQPWQIQQAMPQSWGYGQPTPPKKWNPKKRETVLQNDVVEKKDMETGLLSAVQCFITILLGMLPIVGIFFSLFWVNSPKSPKMKRNMAKGMLIIQGIVLIIMLIALIIWVTGLGTALSSNFV